MRAGANRVFIRGYQVLQDWKLKMEIILKREGKEGGDTQLSMEGVQYYK